MNATVTTPSLSDNAADRASRGASAGFSIATGTLVGAFLLAAVYIYPEGSTRVNIATTVAFVALVVASAAVFLKVRTTIPKGWGARFAAGLGGTMAFYSSALVFALASEVTSPAIWIPVAVAVALPVAILGSIAAKR